jgi:hypothetical protein
MFQQKHGQRVGFLSTRAARTPNAKASWTAAGCGLVLPFRKNVLQQKVEVPGLAKEMGLIGGDAIDHHGTLVQLIGLRYQVVVLLHAVQAQQAQPAGNPAGQQSVLVHSQPDPSLPIDQLLEPSKQC